jgi:protein-S-isoprenylcysteine O-methyltransferase Ste14
MRSYERTKAYDVAIATPILAFYTWTAVQLGGQAKQLFESVVSGNHLAITGLANTVLTIAFATLIVLLVLIRRVPQAKSVGFVPRFAAVGGTIGTFGIALMPYTPLPVPVAILTMVPVLAGLSGAIIVLMWLGRQFSIMPEARQLVTSGPYAIVRHPLYLCEQLAILGLALQHVQPWGLIVFAAQSVLQLTRIAYEERVLANAFPEYLEYSKRTARLIPGVY